MIEGRQAQHIIVDGRKLIIFSSNDYLGLSHHPGVLKAAALAAEKYGCGTGGAPGTSGTTAIHRELADAIAGFKHRDTGVIFPSGYAANVGLHQSLGDDSTIFFSDSHNHPSAADGIRLAGCDKKVYHHRDYDHLEQLLKADKHKRKIVSTCSVFTIDGAICDLKTLTELRQKYDFVLILDEAHATGCLGLTGRGLEEQFRLEGEADFIMGTFSKALGSQGGFLVYNRRNEHLLKLPLRPFDYSTSIAAPTAAASLKALQILMDKPELVHKMRANIGHIYDSLTAGGLELNESGRHIVNVYFGTEEKTRKIADKMKQNGYFVVIINQDNNWGLRITAMAVHSEAEIKRFCEKLNKTGTEAN